MTTSDMDRPFGSMPLAQARALMTSPDRFGTLNDFDLERLTFAAICLYGATEDPAVAAQAAPVFALYHSRAPIACRKAMYQALLDRANAGAVSYALIELFLFVEDDAMLLARAALDYACTKELQQDDPLTGPRTVLNLFRLRRGDPTRAGLFAGLLLLGDGRVTGLLWEARDELEVGELHRVSFTRSGTLYAASILFWLDFLEKLNGDETDSRFGAAASALHRAPTEAPDREVIDIRRDFPLQHSARPIELLQEWTLEEYAAIIAPRLRAIEAREPEPKVMPKVLEAWRIPPVEKAKTGRRGRAARKPASAGPVKASSERIAEVARHPEPALGGEDE
jgi:hypothetical protein